MSNRVIKVRLKKKGVVFFNKLPSSQNKVFKSIFVPKGATKNKADFFIICDKKLSNLPSVKAFLKGKLVYFVSAGEDLKNIDHFAWHFHNIQKKTQAKNIAGFISMGGGSVGDLTGFLASVYKRGRTLVHIPTTWLSAMDSAYGGKTALNAGQVKNILGTYFFPKAVLIVKELLLNQTDIYGSCFKNHGSNFPKRRKRSHKPHPSQKAGSAPRQFGSKSPVKQGEMLKMALIEGGGFYKSFFSSYGKEKNQNLFLWRFLPQAIEAKIRIVEQDPYEKKGQRILLNLGHTLGHVLELYFKLPHGEAVLYGLRFAFEWSKKFWVLSPHFVQEMSFLLKNTQDLPILLQKVPLKTGHRLIQQDKKRRGEEFIDFVFIKGPGQVLSKKVLIKDLMLEFRRQRKQIKT